MSTPEPRWERGFFPPSRWNLVSIFDVQKCLRFAFESWGLPTRMRVDNGYPWGSAGDLPPELALWMLGLGIDMIWNPPARPQDNGVVERSQGVGKNWAEPQTCSNVRELQQRVNKFDHLQRERYPFDGKQSRVEAHPDLRRPKRRYKRTKERSTWNWDLVNEHLKHYAVLRKVDNKGSVSIYNRQRYVGIVYAGQRVVVNYDAVQHEWEFYNGRGQLLRRQPAPELSAKQIYELNVLRHGKTRIPKSRQN
jgi:hypothetical protein